MAAADGSGSGGAACAAYGSACGDGGGVVGCVASARAVASTPTSATPTSPTDEDSKRCQRTHLSYTISRSQARRLQSTTT
jgi:hypothetical protein